MAKGPAKKSPNKTALELGITEIKLRAIMDNFEGYKIPANADLPALLQHAHNSEVPGAIFTESLKRATPLLLEAGRAASNWVDLERILRDCHVNARGYSIPLEWSTAVHEIQSKLDGLVLAYFETQDELDDKRAFYESVLKVCGDQVSNRLKQDLCKMAKEMCRSATDLASAETAYDCLKAHSGRSKEEIDSLYLRTVEQIQKEAMKDREVLAKFYKDSMRFIEGLELKDNDSRFDTYYEQDARLLFLQERSKILKALVRF